MEICRQDAERFGFGKVLTYVEEEGQKGEWWWRDEQGRNPGPHRPALTELVDDIRRGAIQAVIVYKQDRFVRDSGVADALHKIFRESGVRFVCRGRDTEIDTARGLYQAAVDSAAARQWRDQISEDVQRDHDYKFRLRMFTRDPSCFGFRSRGRDSQAVCAVYEELEVVARIYRMFLGIGCPALGVYQIARQLEREGVRVSSGAKGHKVKDPRKVHGTSIRQILENPMYAGYWVHNGERAIYERLLVPPRDGMGEPAPAIPEEWFHQAQAKLSARPKTGRKAATDPRLLSGLTVCAACGGPMHVNSKYLKDGGKTQRWICPRRSGPLRDCQGDSYATIVVDELDAWAREHLAPYLAQEMGLMDREGDGSALRGRVAALERRLEETRAAETRALKAALLGLDEEQVARLARELRAEREDAERRLMEARRALSQREEDLGAPEDLAAEDPARLKEALRRLIRWVAVSDQGVTVLTAMGSYVGARFVERDLGVYNDSSNRRRLEPPMALSTATCLSWIADPARFVAGRRDALGESAARRTDEELLPGAWGPREMKEEDDE